VTAVLALTLAVLLATGAVRWAYAALSGEGARLDAAKAALYVEEE
jgi:hypothetical protein